jgi:hypothetical protein
MIEASFTLDYEIYGNGTGGLKELVYDPGERLRDIFRNAKAQFVAFVEVAELERIETYGADPAIDLVRRQIRNLRRDECEIALHLHPQWYNANYVQGRWVLDASEYNLCTLRRPRIADIVRRALAYMRYVLDEPDFTPLSFRAGNWLFQPTQTAASVLAENGIRVDSSVFKGGVQHNHGLDYRGARRNGFYWRFSGDVNEPDASGPWVEVPIHAEMVPFWRMATAKRIGLGNTFGMAHQSAWQEVRRALDFVRVRYPMKLDFCRMTLSELTSMMNRVIREDRQDPASYRPVVAIGHTKDFRDPVTLEAFLVFLREKGIVISTFERMYPRLLNKEEMTVKCTLCG